MTAKSAVTIDKTEKIPPRERLLVAARQLFYQHGIRAVGVDAIAEAADTNKMTLYRHFASKAQMYEGLIQFIEESVFTLANKITQDEADGRKQAEKLVEMLLAFAEKNPGMVRVMTGDALVGEHERLQARMNQFFERFESQLRQSLRGRAEGDGSATPTVDANVQASVLTAFAVGRLQRYTRSGFKRSPVEHLDAALRLLAA